IKSIVLTFNAALLLMVPSLTVATVSITSADSTTCEGITGNVTNGVNTAIGSGAPASCNSTQNQNNNSLASLAKTVVNIFSLIVGVVAVIMIIYGGFRYITSGGETTAVGNAKNTIIYAIIGLLLVALAQT